MTDFDAFMKSHERHREALAQASERDKAVVFDALAAAGVTTVAQRLDDAAPVALIATGGGANAQSH